MAVGPLVSAGRISCRYTVSVTDLMLANPADGIPLPLYEGTVSAVFHETPKFLTHGPESGSLAVPCRKPHPCSSCRVLVLQPCWSKPWTGFSARPPTGGRPVTPTAR